MAEGDTSEPPAKKQKLELTDYVRQKLFDAVNDLGEEYSYAVCLVKIVKGDASSKVSFTNCQFYEFQRNNELEREETGFGMVFAFSLLFQKGMKLLESIISSEFDIDKCPRAIRTAYERLKYVLTNSNEIGQRLWAKAENETSWTVILAHHLLKNLAVNQRYVVDHSSNNKQGSGQNVECPCCKTVDLCGLFGDCSLGDERVIHGSVDILLGGIGVGAVGVEFADEMRDAAFEVKKTRLAPCSINQITIESIVLGFVQAKDNPQFENFLIPTIAISGTEVAFFMYDPENDMLLESAKCPIFSAKVGELKYTTIVALWLAINYPLFCSGVTQKMKERSFTSDFLLHSSEDVSDIYKKSLRFGNIKSISTHNFAMFDKQNDILERRQFCTLLLPKTE